MKTICLVGLVGACCLAAGLVSAVGGDDRELRELARRVDKLERSRDEMNRTIDRLAKSVADLEKSLGSNERTGDRRDLTSRGEKQDKRLVELEKRVEELSKILAEVRKQADPKGDFLDTLNRKIDGRTTQLAKWFDEYHPRKDIGSHHRDAIERIR